MEHGDQLAPGEGGLRGEGVGAGSAEEALLDGGDDLLPGPVICNVRILPGNALPLRVPDGDIQGLGVWSKATGNAGGARGQSPDGTAVAVRFQDFQNLRIVVGPFNLHVVLVFCGIPNGQGLARVQNGFFCSQIYIIPHRLALLKDGYGRVSCAVDCNVQYFVTIINAVSAMTKCGTHTRAIQVHGKR